MLPRAGVRRGPLVSFRFDGKPIVLGVVFPSIAIAQRDVRAALSEQYSVAARARLVACLMALEGAKVDGAVPVPLDGLGGLR